MSVADAAPVESTRPLHATVADGVECAIRLQQVSKRFGVVPAVADLTLDVPRGSVFGLIGPNGAGKTTTFSMIAGFLRASTGQIAVLGHDPQDVPRLRGRLGVLPQDAVLPPLDRVGEFLVHLARAQGIEGKRAEEAARGVLAEVAGVEWWSVPCRALSHGMAKRVGIAQALLGDPELVLLDEPTAGLDPRVAHEVRALIRSRKGRCTLVISSHNLHELEELCDGAAILDRGRLVAAGSMKELTASSREIRIELAEGPIPLEPVRAVPVVKRADYDEASRTLIVHFDPAVGDAETVIAHVLWVLLHEKARISGVTKGRGLEQRVMELTA